MVNLNVLRTSEVRSLGIGVQVWSVILVHKVYFNGVRVTKVDNPSEGVKVVSSNLHRVGYGQLLSTGSAGPVLSTTSMHQPDYLPW